MRTAIAAALALTAASSLHAQATTDLSYAPPIAGSWSYAPTATGSEATFSNSAGHSQVTIRCTRPTRRIALLKPASAASATLWVWTSGQSRSLPATFDAASARVAAELGAYDGFLDAIALSRGRLGFSTPGVPPLVVPAWPETARVIEDCRA